MLETTRNIGYKGEKIALEYLEQLGLIVQDLNFQVKGSEIDIIALEDQTLSFIEVKYRRSLTFGSPLESITLSKQRRMFRGAQTYLLKHSHHGPVRFDVLGITDIKGTERHYEYIRNAFNV